MGDPREAMWEVQRMADRVCNMLGAIALVRWQNSFFMNWTGQQAGEGFEYHLLAIAISLALVLVGAGNWSIDKAIASWWHVRRDAPEVPHAR